MRRVFGRIRSLSPLFSQSYHVDTAMLSSRLSRLHGAKCVWKAQVLRRNIAPFPAVTIQSAKFSSQDIFPGVHKLVAEKKLHYFNLPEVMDDTVRSIVSY